MLALLIICNVINTGKDRRHDSLLNQEPVDPASFVVYSVLRFLDIPDDEGEFI